VPPLLSPATCAAPATPAPLCARPRAAPASASPLPGLALASPRRDKPHDCLPEPCFTAARRRSNSSASSYSRWFHASLPCAVAALPTPCWPALASSTLRCLCPSYAAVATCAAEAPAPACAWAHPLLDPENPLKLLALLLSRLHTHNSLDPSCSDHLPSPDPCRHPWSPSAAPPPLPNPRSSAPTTLP
jgi:hypothetical protein